MTEAAKNLAPANPPQGKLIYLAHRQIKADPSRNCRKVYEQDSTENLHKVSGLAESIAANGMETPVWVLPPKDGTHELIAGFRRYRAVGLLQSLGRAPDDYPIPALVFDSATDAIKYKLLNASENTARKGLLPWELAEICYDLVENEKVPIADVAREFARHPNYLTNLVRARRDLIPALWERFKSAGKAGMKTSGALYWAARPVEEQEKEAAKLAAAATAPASERKKRGEAAPASVSLDTEGVQAAHDYAEANPGADGRWMAGYLAGLEHVLSGKRPAFPAAPGETKKRRAA